MGIDIRYLVVTLVAVFIALGVGVLAGAGMTSQPSVEALSQRIEKGFKSEFERYRQELERKKAAEENLKTQIETYERYFNASFPHLIHERLVGRRIAIVHTTGRHDFPTLHDELVKVLTQAGASVVSVTLINRHGAVVPKDVVQRLAQRYQITETSEQAILSQVVAHTLAGGDLLGTMNYLHKVGFLQSSGDYAQPANAVVIVGGDEEENADAAQRMDVPLIKTLKALNVLCVGCETTGVTHSFIPVYQRVGISTVDNVNTPMGQVALVLALSGYNGHFGVKTTAEGLLPSVK
ncbi:MAG: copper transporter [Abditibacteriales bacterium]|nr:copper transporter [Abditibacteriales bacterium]MDW8366895.1 copper transporter [Abditibacteriales bacterium]